MCVCSNSPKLIVKLCIPFFSCKVYQANKHSLKCRLVLGTAIVAILHEARISGVSLHECTHLREATTVVSHLQYRLRFRMGFEWCATGAKTVNFGMRNCARSAIKESYRVQYTHRKIHILSDDQPNSAYFAIKTRCGFDERSKQAYRRPLFDAWLERYQVKGRTAGWVAGFFPGIAILHGNSCLWICTSKNQIAVQGTQDVLIAIQLEIPGGSLPKFLTWSRYFQCAPGFSQNHNVVSKAYSVSLNFKV